MERKPTSIIDTFDSSTHGKLVDGILKPWKAAAANDGVSGSGEVVGYSAISSVALISQPGSSSPFAGRRFVPRHQDGAQRPKDNREAPFKLRSKSDKKE